MPFRTDTFSAHYEYDPFGNVLRATGPMAFLNPFRFSTKYTDGESGFNYYGYRFYNAAVGRWVSRDPKDALSHILNAARRFDLSEYTFARNVPSAFVDPQGLDLIEITYDDGMENTYWWPSFPEFNTTIANAASASKKIKEIVIKGHGDCCQIGIGDDPLQVNSTGTGIIGGDDGTDITQALKEALAPGALIYLAGCGSAREDDNISKSMSALLPGVTVCGHAGRKALNVPLCACALGKKRCYLNGVEK